MIISRKIETGKCFYIESNNWLQNLNKIYKNVVTNGSMFIVRVIKQIK